MNVIVSAAVIALVFSTGYFLLNWLRA